MGVSKKDMQHVSDIEYSIQLNKWVLKPIGVWPASEETSALENVISHVLKVICLFFMLVTIVPATLYLFLDEKDSMRRLVIFGPLSHFVMGALNYCSLLLRSKDIRRCIEHLEEDWRTVDNPKDRERMLENAKMGRVIAICCTAFMQVGVMSYFVSVNVKKVPIRVDNETRLIHVIGCPPYSKFIDSNRELENLIVMIIQIVASFIVNSVTAGACGLSAVFAMHACGQFSIVNSRFDFLVDQKGKSRKVEEQKLADIVKRHMRTLRFISLIEEVTQQVCLVELVGCTMNMCLLGYYCIMTWKVSDTETMVAYCIVYISMCFNIFIFCHIGEILANQCQQIGEVAYMTDWYLLSSKTAMCLILVILKSSIVLRITAGKLVRLSYSTFGDVLKTSLAYLNMLRAMM